VWISSSQSSVKSFGILVVGWSEPVGSCCIRSRCQFCDPVLHTIFVCWGPGFVAEGQGQLQSWKDNIHKWQIALMRSCSVLFFSWLQWIPMDSNSIPGRFELWSGFLSILQVFYTSDAARESFVELCEEEYVQKAGSASPTIFHKCPIFQTWGTKRKPKTWQGLVVNCPKLSNFRENSPANFSSGPLSNWSDQGLWVSQS